ncbi:MAG TPA: hypothetical protein VF692_04525 [Pyrinomonadaceae bacterium]|jgi:hypothetical protein
MNISEDTTKLRRLAASLFVVLSLFVSSISACVCAHHLFQAEADEHCQPPTEQHSLAAKKQSHHSHDDSVENNRHDDSTETKNLSVSASQSECCCVEAAPKTFGKFEKYKTGKQTARLLPNTPVEISPARQIVRVYASEFATPFYLFDSFYNVPHGRAPPRL